MSIIETHYGLPEKRKQEDCKEPWYAEADRRYLADFQKACGYYNAITDRTPSTIFERMPPREEAMVDFIIKLNSNEEEKEDVVWPVTMRHPPIDLFENRPKGSIDVIL